MAKKQKTIDDGDELLESSFRFRADRDDDRIDLIADGTQILEPLHFTEDRWKDFVRSMRRFVEKD